MNKGTFANITALGLLLVANPVSLWASSSLTPPPAANSPHSSNPTIGGDSGTTTHDGGGLNTIPDQHTGSEEGAHDEYNPSQPKQYDNKTAPNNLF